jgi:hypothetical protein
MSPYSIKFNVPIYSSIFVNVKINVLVITVFTVIVKSWVSQDISIFVPQHITSESFIGASGYPPTSKVHVIPILKVLPENFLVGS